MSYCALQGSQSSDADVKCVIEKSKTIAVVGLSPKEENPSNDVAKYLQQNGFRVIPVNPNCQEVLGEKCYPDLKSIPEHIDLVDIFRKLEAIPAVVEEAVKIGADAVWMQLGLEHEESAQFARNAGLKVIMNKCIKTEHARFFGEGEKSE